MFLKQQCGRNRVSRLTETVTVLSYFAFMASFDVETVCERPATASVDNFLISFEHRNFLQLFFIIINKLQFLEITVNPGINLVTAFRTAASVAFPLSDM